MWRAKKDRVLRCRRDVCMCGGGGGEGGGVDRHGEKWRNVKTEKCRG